MTNLRIAVLQHEPETGLGAGRQTWPVAAALGSAWIPLTAGTILSLVSAFR